MELPPDAPSPVAPPAPFTPRFLVDLQAADPNLWRVIDTSLHEQYLQSALRALHGAVERERDEPLLGLATTRQLLDEVATRMEITQNSEKGRDLGSFCREAILHLSDGVLDYRTVGSW